MIKKKIIIFFEGIFNLQNENFCPKIQKLKFIKVFLITQVMIQDYTVYLQKVTTKLLKLTKVFLLVVN